MLLDYQLVVVKMLNESLGKNQIVTAGRDELEEVAVEQLCIGYSVYAQVLAYVGYLVGVINAGDAITELPGKVDHVVAGHATDLDGISAAGASQKLFQDGMMFKNRPLVRFGRRQMRPCRIPKLSSGSV